LPFKPRLSLRGNVPLLLAGIVTVASLVVVLAVLLSGGEPESPPETPTVARPSEPAAAGDPIGDLIAGLPDKPAAGPRARPEAPDAAPLEGEPAWRRYATAVAIPQGRPAIAVVIDDVGANRRQVDAAIALPAAVTLAFMPYGEDVQRQVDRARTAGHEVLLHLPMQPEAGGDPGPKALLTSLPPGALAERIAWNMDRFTGYVGFNNHMGSKFTADAAGMGAVMREAKARGLMFLDSRTTSRSQGRAAALRFGVPMLERDLFLDNEATQAAVRGQLDKAVELARRRGSAIVIGHPHPETLAALKAWIPTLSDVSLVPITALLDRPTAPALAAE
jgi:polysaccharide deacetylase 2 family uncharacterized protein YibQ